MNKEKTFFTCASCTYKTIKWIGCCPGCNNWDTLKETTLVKNTHCTQNTASLQPLSHIPLEEKERMLSGISEWDRVVGGGIMPSSLIVLTGDPGIGKSTLLLQICNALASTKKVFYFSTEESIQQVKHRALRLGCINELLLISDESQLESIIHTAETAHPDIVVIDSIQNCSVKNRFGTINELGFFEMHSKGLQEITDINKQLLSDMHYCPGSALISLIEGSRPLLLELQTLTVPSKLSIPQRVISGIDHKQVVLIAAIIEKYLHIKLSAHDIFCKISGGFKINNSASDLGITLALLSSYFQKELPDNSLILGEISLTGTIKPVKQINIYIKEAEKFGIKKIFVAKNQHIPKTDCSIVTFSNVYELLSLFGSL